MGLFSNLGIRFREQYIHPEKSEVLLERFRTKQKEGISSLVIQMAYHSVFLKVPPKSHKWWSPELTINIEEHEDGSIIKEVTGPNPGTFTLAMFVIIGAIVIFFFALMFAFSQIQLGTSALISLLVIVGSVIIALLVIMVLGWGRKKAHPQREMMKDFVKNTLETQE